MNDILENSMVTEDEEPAPTPIPEDGDELYDLQRADNDYADLCAELVAITRLAALKHRIEGLHEDICSSLIEKPRV